MNAGVRGTAAPSPPDAAVIERAKHGDHEAFRVLVERYQGRAYGLALRVLRDEEQARDAVQDAFLKVYGSLGKFEGRSGFYTWLYRLVMNVCLDMKRRDRSGRQVEWEEERAVEIAQGAEALAPGGADPGRSGPEAELERAQLRDAMAPRHPGAARFRPPDARAARDRRPQLRRDREGPGRAERHRDEPALLRAAAGAGRADRGGRGERDTRRGRRGGLDE